MVLDVFDVPQAHGPMGPLALGPGPMGTGPWVQVQPKAWDRGTQCLGPGPGPMGPAPYFTRLATNTNWACLVATNNHWACY